MTRIDTGAVVGQAGPFTSLSTYGGSFVPTAVRIGLPLEAQVTYRLSFSVSTDVGFNGRAGFIMNSAQYKGGATPMTFTQRAAEHSILKSVTAPAWAERAFGLIRWRGSGEVILSVNGTPLEQERTSDSLNADGAACLETEFSLTSLPAGALTATLEMRPTGDMEIYDYGLIWR